MPDKSPPNPYFFTRQPDGTARVRLKILAPEAALYEEAAGDMKVTDWIHRTLQKEAKREVAARRAKQQIPPPNGA